MGTIALARTVSYCFAKNPTLFPSPPVPLTLFNDDIKAVEALEAAAKTGPRHLYGTRDALLVFVTSDLDFLCAYVQWLVDRDPTNGPALAEKAGMAIAGPRTRDTSLVRLRKSTKVTHGVDVVIRRKSDRESHYIEHSLDGGVTWLKNDPILKAVLTLGPFTPGTLVMVRVRTLTKDGKGEPSDPVSIIVT